MNTNRFLGGENMNLLAMILNGMSTLTANTSEVSCPLYVFDEPKMPASMIK